MMNLNTITAVALSVLVGSNLDLNTNVKNNTAQPVEISAAAQTNSVLIDDFTQEIYSWWTGSEGKYTLERTDDEMLKVKITDAGNPSVANGYQCFGRQFESVDFSKTPVLKLKMKVDAGTPKVRIDIKDANGMVANAKPIIKTVSGSEFKEYYYDFSGKFEQSWPSKETVDPAEIVELLMYVSPGGPSYSGTLFIDDVSAVAASEVPKQ